MYIPGWPGSTMTRPQMCYTYLQVATWTRQWSAHSMHNLVDLDLQWPGRKCATYLQVATWTRLDLQWSAHSMHNLEQVRVLVLTGSTMIRRQVYHTIPKPKVYNDLKWDIYNDALNLQRPNERTLYLLPRRGRSLGAKDTLKSVVTNTCDTLYIYILYTLQQHPVHGMYNEKKYIYYILIKSRIT